MRASCMYNLFVLSVFNSRPALEFSSFQIIQFRSGDVEILVESRILFFNVSFTRILSNNRVYVGKLKKKGKESLIYYNENKIINAFIFLRLTREVSSLRRKLCKIVIVGTTDSCSIVCAINAKFAKPCGNRNKKARIGWKGQAAGTSVAFYDEAALEMVASPAARRYANPGCKFMMI